MGSRLLPLFLALGASVADATRFHHLGGLLVLVTIPCALAAVCEAVASHGWGRSALNGTALGLLVVASAVRHAAPLGAHVPTVALSAVLAAAVLYVVPVLVWVLQPVSLRPVRA